MSGKRPQASTSVLARFELLASLLFFFVAGAANSRQPWTLILGYWVAALLIYNTLPARWQLVSSGCAGGALILGPMLLEDAFAQTAAGALAVLWSPFGAAPPLASVAAQLSSGVSPGLMGFGMLALAVSTRLSAERRLLEAPSLSLTDWMAEFKPSTEAHAAALKESIQTLNTVLAENSRDFGDAGRRWDRVRSAVATLEDTVERLLAATDVHMARASDDSLEATQEPRRG